MSKKASKKPKVVTSSGNPLADLLRAQHGEESSFLIDGMASHASVPTLAMSGMLLNDALGGGLAWGRLVEVFGSESSGKTTLALDAVACMQRDDPKAHALYLDVEHALDPKWAGKLGVDFKRLVISQPKSAEQAADMLTTALEAGEFAPRVIVLDSIAALATEAELAGEAGDQVVGAVARLLSKSCKKWVRMLADTGVLLIMINQERDQVKFGSAPGAKTTPGGKAVRFYASQRITVFGKKIYAGKDDPTPIGIEQHAKVVKNKVAPPFAQAITRIWFDRGIDVHVELVEAARMAGVVKVDGSWVKATLPGYARADRDGVVTLGNGLAAAVAAVRGDDELRSMLRDAVRSGGQAAVVPTAKPAKAARKGKK